MDKCRLIISADDFGLSREVNAAVIRAHRFGTLTSCSLMAAGDAAAEAGMLSRQNRRLSVGVHLTTVMGKSVLPHREIPAIVDREGRFPDDPTAAGLKYFFSSKARKDLRKELHAQIEAVFSLGILPSHLDSHLHLHIHPTIFAMALDLGREFGIPRMRVPEDDIEPALRHDRSALAHKRTMNLIFRCLTQRMKRRLNGEGFRYPSRLYGFFMTGQMTLEYVLSVLEHLPSGVSELYFHPAIHEPRSWSMNREDRQRRKEYDILTSEAFRSKIRKFDISLIGYNSLDEQP